MGQPVVPYQSRKAWKVSLLTLDSIAVLCTCLRLWLRHRKSILWWDDACVVIPTVAMICVMAFYEDGMGIFAGADALGNPILSNHWKAMFLYLSVVWWSRITLAIGLVRIFPSWSRSRQVALSLAGFFVSIWLFAIIFYPVSCKAPFPWTRVNWFECSVIKATPEGFVTVTAPTIALILNFIGDSLLVICPLYMLWGLRLPSSERRLILVLFSSSAATFMVVIAMTVVFNIPFQYTESRGTLCGGLTHLECTAAFLVCNFVPVAGFFYRVYRTSKTGRTLVYIPGAGTKSSPAQIPTTISKSITVEVDTDNDTHHIPLKQYQRGRGDYADSFNDQPEKSGGAETKDFGRAV